MADRPRDLFSRVLARREAAAGRSRPSAALFYLLRLVRETTREFVRDNCLLRATGLAYQTLISLVPLIVVVVAIVSSFGLKQPEPGPSGAVPGPGAASPGPGPSASPLPASPEPVPSASPGPSVSPGPGAEILDDARRRDVIDKVMKFIPIQDEERRRFTEWLRGTTREVAGGAGSLGLAAFLFTVLLMLRGIEQAFNAIWSAPRHRAFFPRLAIFTAILFWGPLFLFASFSVSAFVRGTSYFELLRAPSWLQGWTLTVLLPVAMTFLALGGLYVWLPNVRVRIRPALVGAGIAAIAYESAKHGFQALAPFLIRNYPAYGTLAVLPLLFLWLYIAWAIVLFGAEVSFTVQNFDDLTRKEERARRGVRARVYYAVRTVLEVCRRFARAQGPQPVDDLIARFDVPEYVLEDISATLAERGVLTRVAGAPGAPTAYLPARAVTDLAVEDVVRAMEGEPLAAAAVREEDAAHRAVARLFAEAASARTGALAVTFDKLIEEAEGEAAAEGGRVKDEG